MNLKPTFLSIPNFNNIFEVFNHGDNINDYLIEHCKKLGIKNKDEYIFMTDQLPRIVQHDTILNTCLDILKHNLYLPYLQDKLKISHVINLINQTTIIDTSNPLMKNETKVVRDIFDIRSEDLVSWINCGPILSIIYETYMYHERYKHCETNDTDFYTDLKLYNSKTEQFIDILISSDDSKLDIIYKSTDSILELSEEAELYTPNLKYDHQIITTTDIIKLIANNTSSPDFTENIFIQIDDMIFELSPPLF